MSDEYREGYKGQGHDRDRDRGPYRRGSNHRQYGGRDSYRTHYRDRERDPRDRDPRDRGDRYGSRYDRGDRYRHDRDYRGGDRDHRPNDRDHRPNDRDNWNHDRDHRSSDRDQRDKDYRGGSRDHRDRDHRDRDYRDRDRDHRPGDRPLGSSGAPHGASHERLLAGQAHGEKSSGPHGSHDRKPGPHGYERTSSYERRDSREKPRKKLALASTVVELKNPWVDHFGVTDPSLAQLMETSFKQLRDAEIKLAELEAARLKTLASMNNYDRLLKKEALSIALQTERVEELALM